MEINNIKALGTIMFHTNNLKKERQIKELCRSLGLVTRAIKQQDINRPVGTIGVQGGIKSGSIFSKGEKIKAPDKYKLPELIIFRGYLMRTLISFLKNTKNQE